MNTKKLEFKIKKSELGRKLIYIQILYNCFIKFAIGHLHIPSIANYLTDVFTLVILILMLDIYHFSLKKSRYNALIFLFIGSTIIGFIINGYSLILYLWGARNIFRFFIFFLGCIAFFNDDDVIKLFDILEKICWINIVMALFERYVMHYIGDASSGFYSIGNMSGGNGSINILFCVVIAYQLSRLLNNEIKIKKIVVTICGIIIVSASIELKYFFVELIAIIIIFIAIQKPTIKNLAISISIIFIIMVGMDYLVRLYPEWADIFSIESMIANGQYYGAQEKIGRLNGVSFMLDNFLNTSMQKIFGLGLGNADYSSSFSSLTSDFYINHTYLSYEYFQSAWMTLENGILGLGIYLIWLIEPFRYAWKFKKEKSVFIYMSMLFSVIAVLQLLYNQMLRVETSGYLMALCLAVIFIHTKNIRG